MFMSSKKLPHLNHWLLSASHQLFSVLLNQLCLVYPVVLNPFLIIPFVVTHTITGALTYWLTAIGFVGKMYLNLPWATPSPILGYLAAGGSIGGFVIVFINFLIGMVTSTILESI